MSHQSNPLTADLHHILDHTRDLWPELKRGRLFLTGGTGFFGCWLLESFLFANEQLGLNASAHVLTRTPGAFKAKVPHLANHPDVSLVEGDVRSFEFPEGSFSHIIHGATESVTKIPGEPHRELMEVIVEGTRHTLDFALQAGTQKFLLTSSGAVYGKQPRDIPHLTEDFIDVSDKAGTRDIYGEGKRKAELLCEGFSTHTFLEPKIARCFAFVGPYLPLDAHFAVGNFLLDALNGGPIIVQGDGTPIRSYLYSADLAIWLWTILLKGRSCRAYNVGSEKSVTISGLAGSVADLFGGVEVRIRDALQDRGDRQRYVPSTTRAREELGLDEWVHLPEALSRTRIWWQSRR